MSMVEDYVARIEETCGEEKHFIVVFKYEVKNKVIAKILERAKVEKSFSQIVFELTFGSVSFRLYGTGKAIFRSLRDKEELHKVLVDLLL
ncbi:hypothetical protein E3J49_00060 [Candidatus Bathyarchaeota archaeon]|nr:hypothetical protein [Candidatus Bathyarchaeota archaeon]TET66066.1 MAG: hypothetical protein E3J49_00060 [Candidatus Bathyarchaeota archaeon]